VEWAVVEVDLSSDGMIFVRRGVDFVGRDAEVVGVTKDGEGCVVGDADMFEGVVEEVTVE
jgi:hypothetical protein